MSESWISLKGDDTLGNSSSNDTFTHLQATPFMISHPPSALLIYLGYLSPFMIVLGLVNNALVLYLFRSSAFQVRRKRPQPVLSVANRKRGNRPLFGPPLSAPATPARQVGFGRDAHPIQVNRVQPPATASIRGRAASASAGIALVARRAALPALGSSQSLRSIAATTPVWQKRRWERLAPPIHLPCPGERITATFYCFLAVADIVVILSLHLSYFLGAYAITFRQHHTINCTLNYQCK